MSKRALLRQRYNRVRVSNGLLIRAMAGYGLGCQLWYILYSIEPSPAFRVVAIWCTNILCKFVNLNLQFFYINIYLLLFVTI